MSKEALELRPDLSPTVYGIETEYSCLITLPGNIVHEIVGSCHSVDAKLGLYTQPQDKGSRYIGDDLINKGLEAVGIYRNSDTGMMSNGGRLYIDPSGPEYATPETTTAEEAVHRTFDGDNILLSVFEFLRKAGKLEGYQVNRRIVDHNRTSRGIHLNTATTLDADEPIDSIKLKLATLNVAKGAIFGSGGLLIDEQGRSAFHHSPRLSITSKISEHYGNYRNRPLVRYPFKQDGTLARIETVTSDALNFAWPIRASLVATNALVKMIERNVPGLPILRDPIRAAAVVGRHGNANQVSIVRRDEFEGARPLNVLVEICEKALTEHEKIPFLDPESLQVLNEIIDVSDQMTRDPDSVATQVESIARKIAIERKMDKEGVTIDSEKICRFDYAWDWLGGGLAERLRQKNLAGWQGFDDQYSVSATKKRLTEPPQDTRAKLRGKVIKDEKGHNRSDWEDIERNLYDEENELFNSECYYVHPLDSGDDVFPEK